MMFSQIVPLRKYTRSGMPDGGMWRRRHAIQIVAQLPDNYEDALAVLKYAEELVRGFLTPLAAGGCIRQSGPALRLVESCCQVHGEPMGVAEEQPVQGETGNLAD